MATITFHTMHAMTVFRSMSEREDHETDKELIAKIDSSRFATYSSQGKWSITIELDDELAEAAREVLWQCLNIARNIPSDHPEANNYRDFAGQVVIDPEEAPDPRVAMIPLTEKETRILATLLFHATTDDYPQLTADVATNLLEKLRYAVFK
jgi:hypothetical protein